MPKTAFARLDELNRQSSALSEAEKLELTKNNGITPDTDLLAKVYSMLLTDLVSKKGKRK